MAFITWSDDFLTGIDIVDEQHQKLVGMINTAAPVLLDCHPGNSAQRLTLFKSLLDYTGYHFQTEEALMVKHGVDPRVLNHHRQTHAQLVEEVKSRQAGFDCQDPSAGQKLLGFLAGWLLFHVLGEDQTMGRQLRAITAGKSAGQAFAEDGGNQHVPNDWIMSQLVVRLYTEMSGQVHAINQQNNLLEKRVSERTAELESTLRALANALEAAEAANKAKQRFLGIVSHELRTPMNAIMGFADILGQQSGTTSDRGLSQHILKASSHLRAMIDGLIEFSNDEVGKKVPVELKSLLQSACRQGFMAAHEKGLHYELRLDAALPAVLLGDGPRIALVVQQLTNNAAKFTAVGEIIVQMEPLGQPQSGHQPVRISVTDTGIGLSEVDRKMLFEIFHQGDDSPTRSYGGMGLGLALAQHAARMMGTVIQVKSTTGKGSRFWFDLDLEVTNPSEMPIPTDDVTTAAPARDESQARSMEPPIQLAPVDIDQLKHWLLESDTRVLDVLLSSEQSLRALLGNNFEAFHARVTNFEFADAHALLEHTIGTSTSRTPR